MIVWVLGRDFPTKENNMKGSFEFEQAQMLKRHGIDVFFPVVDLRFIHRTKRLGMHERNVDGVHVVKLYVPLALFCPKGKRHLLMERSMKLLFHRMLKKYGCPDIIHVHYPSIFPEWMFCEVRRHGVKIVGTEHWTKVQNKELYPQTLENLKACVKFYSALFCVGEPLRKSIIELTGTDRQITVVPNVVSKDFSFAPDENKDGLFYFLGIGRLVPVKCFDLLIKAFCTAFSDNKAVRLLIVGDGPERDSLENLIKSLDCGDQVSLLGVKNRQEVVSIYHKSNALVVASNLETFGVPIIEAMASGLPVVTTDAMGFPHLFHEEHGLIVPSNDYKALAKAMLFVFEHYDNYDRASIAAYASAHFSEDVIFTQLKEKYDEVLS